MSILHWVSSDRHKCGYCGSGNSISHGLWAETLTVDDYQNMIDRGWRRSGKYCYKPIMNETCCPQYTIRCAALNFNPSKSQKKVIKKFNKYLREGQPSTLKEIGNSDETDEFMGADGDEPGFTMPDCVKEIGSEANLSLNQPGRDTIAMQTKIETTTMVDSNNVNRNEANTSIQCVGSSSSFKEVKKGVGADASKPQCQKAKVLRQKRREAKLLEKPTGNPTTNKKLKINLEKSLNDLLNEQTSNNIHKIQVKLISLEKFEWEKHRKIEFELYKKYQMVIHKDPADKCSVRSFENFLVDSPLERVSAFGTFHQQYWLDDKLIAVGVIDILPKCVSSVYLFYDPDYRYLTLGTYSALREVEFAQSLHLKHPSIEYYYMGFYIHSCPKMRYKGKFSPSDLLCPETYAWTPIIQCFPLLDANKYSRLQNAEQRDVNICTPGPILDGLNIIENYALHKARDFRNRESYVEIFTTLGLLLGIKLIPKVFIVL